MHFVCSELVTPNCVPSTSVLCCRCRYKWDNNEKHLKPETGLLQLRAGLRVFANLRPATVLPQVIPTPHLSLNTFHLCTMTVWLFNFSVHSQLVDASTLKKEVAEGVDIMVVRELTGGNVHQILCKHESRFLFHSQFNMCSCTLINPVLAISNNLQSSITGIYFGKPRGFGTNDSGEETGFNTEVYSVSEVPPPSIRYYASTVS